MFKGINEKRQTIVYCLHNNFLYVSYEKDVKKGYMSDCTIPEINNLMKEYRISEYEENKYSLDGLDFSRIDELLIHLHDYKSSEKLLEIVKKGEECL